MFFQREPDLPSHQGGIVCLNGTTPKKLGIPAWRARVGYVAHIPPTLHGTPSETYFSAQVGFSVGIVFIGILLHCFVHYCNGRVPHHGVLFVYIVLQSTCVCVVPEPPIHRHHHHPFHSVLLHSEVGVVVISQLLYQIWVLSKQCSISPGCSCRCVGDGCVGV